MAEAYIIDAVRTPVGKRGGGLSAVHSADLGAHVIKALVERGSEEGFELLVVNYPDQPAFLAGGDYTKSTYFGLPERILGPHLHSGSSVTFPVLPLRNRCSLIPSSPQEVQTSTGVEIHDIPNNYRGSRGELQKILAARAKGAAQEARNRTSVCWARTQEGG